MADVKDDERSLHQMVYQLEAAWNAADGASFAEAFAEDADFIHILGGYYTGAPPSRPAIG